MAGPAGEIAWRRCKCDGGACVEVAASGEVVMMRSSADPEATLYMSSDEWREFLVGAKDGMFDDL